MNEQTKTLDFTNEKVQTLTLEELKKTHKENDVYGEPLLKIYHSDLIEQIAEIGIKNNLDIEIKEIFAAQNKDKLRPGVTILPAVEDIYGKNAIEAHMLRRIMANIQISNADTEELTTNIAIAYHQDGIEIGFGNMVIACHNQCIMYAEQKISTQGKNGYTIQSLLQIIDIWLKEFNQRIDKERTLIEQMKNRILTPQEILILIGQLQTIRIACDTRNNNIKIKDQYPLNQNQLNIFTEKMLIAQNSKNEITLWDTYNAATEIYKAENMEIPNIMTQNVAMAQHLKHYL